MLVLLLLLVLPLHAQERAHARSMVISRHGIVSTSQTLASQAGAQILARGGSAIDAAIAANAMLGLTEPQMCGIGGDLFVLYWDAKTGKLTGLNASGWTPKNLTIEFLKNNNHKEMARSGIHSATVPGCVAGWDKLHRKFGKVAFQHGLLGNLMQALETRFPSAAADRSDGLKLVLSDGWIHVRASNTEPLLRVAAEARSQKSVEDLYTEVLSLFQA